MHSIVRRAPLEVLRFPNLKSGSHTARRMYSTSPPSRTRIRHPLRITLLLASAISGGALLSLYSDAKSCPSPPFKLVETASRPEHDELPPLRTLFRTYFVYGLASYETIVDHAPQILDTLLKVPLVGTIVEGIVRRTFFDHFVGGETARAAFPLLSALRNQNKGALFSYSVEVDEHQAVHNNEGPVSGKSNNQPAHKRIVAEMIRSIDVAADFEDKYGTKEAAGRRTWVAIKLTALLPNVDALRKLSLHLTHTRPALSPPIPYPGTPESSDLGVLHGRIPQDSPLTSQDVEDLKELYHDLNRICTRAKGRSVRIILDAEHSWYQPAIDAFGHALMTRYNKLPDDHVPLHGIASGPKNASGAELQPIVYVTYQAYLRRTPGHLAHSLALARKNNYALGVKLVRGAYHPQELAAYSAAASSTTSTPVSISPDPYPPVHPCKPDTDKCYNECAALLVKAIADDVRSGRTAPHIGVLFGTHNWTSSELIIEELVNNGIAHQYAASPDGNYKGIVTVPSDVAERFTLAQLYGMSDSLTSYLVGRIQSATPCVIKYVPYGALVEVMPYISRRAIENKSVLGDGGAVRERKEAARLIWKRVFGGIGL